jgi:hypothetical protein
VRGRAGRAQRQGHRLGAVAGFLHRFLDAPVNQVSAPLVAADRGIAVRELRTAAPRGKYASLVVLRVHSADGYHRHGRGDARRGRGPRLVKWLDFEIEAPLGGHTLVVTNLDKPGVIGFLGTTLGNANVNVSRVHLGVAGSAGAISVWNLDSAIPSSVLDELRRSPNVSSAIALTV